MRKPHSSPAFQTSFPTIFLLEAPYAQATGPRLPHPGALPATLLARVSLTETGRARNSHTELPQPSWHIFKGEPCQEPVPVGLSDPWKPCQHAGSSRSQPTLFTKHRLCRQRGNWQKLLFLWMNLLTSSDLSQASPMPALWQSLALTPLSLESHAGGAGSLQAERSAGSD